MGIRDWKKVLAAATAVGLLGVGGAAFAQNDTYYSSRNMKRPSTQLGYANVRIGGGFEGPTGELSGLLTGGPEWLAGVGIQPLPFLGMEANYTGATAEVDQRIFGGDQGATSGADFVRNGADVTATVNLPTPLLQPYVLAGLGVDYYNYRGVNSAQFDDDTSGRVPLGGGLKANAGPVLADLRANYNILMSQNFAESTTSDKIGGTYNINLQVGGQF